MTDEEIAFLTIADAIARIRSGRLSQADLVQAKLRRIARHDRAIASFLHCPEEMPAEGELSGEARLLTGIPLGVKDIIDTADMPTTFNSALFRDHQAERDAECVVRLRAAGAIILGKLAAWECGVGGTSFTLPWPPARNPWRLDRDPGGSSTGSAAAVAAGFCMGTLGSDTGGSIREPASWCGIAGLKATYGLVPAAGVMAASYSLDHVGPMALTSLDCALLMDALADTPAECRFSVDIAGGVSEVRIGVVDLDAEAGLELQPEIADAIDLSVNRLSHLGAVTTRVRLPPLDLFSAVCTLLAGAEGYLIHRSQLAQSPGLYDALTRQRLLAGKAISASDYVAADCVRASLVRQVEDIMAGLDLLIMPITRTTAPLLGGFDSHGGHPSLARPWNVTGSPALSVRAGFDRQGLPIGLQIVGKPFADPLVLRAGYALEQALCCSDAHPDLRDDAAPSIGQSVPLCADAEGLGHLGKVNARAVELVNAAFRDGVAPARTFRP